MSHRSSEARPESNGSWLPLVEYSVRSGMSASTIRRKIKSNSIKFRLENGRYLIFYQEVQSSKPATSVASAELRAMAKVEPEKTAPPVTPFASASPKPAPTKKVQPQATSAEALALPFIDKAVKMVSEAFEQTLKEKDERIRLLEKRNQDIQERLNELRILVQALEEKYEVRY